MTLTLCRRRRLTIQFLASQELLTVQLPKLELPVYTTISL
jgi:hypothetical protein